MPIQFKIKEERNMLEQKVTGLCLVNTVNGKIHSGQTPCAGARKLSKEKQHYCNTAADAVMYARQKSQTPKKCGICKWKNAFAEEIELLCK